MIKQFPSNFAAMAGIYRQRHPEHKVIDRIIASLKLTFEAERPPPPQVFHQELMRAAEERGEYF